MNGSVYTTSYAHHHSHWHKAVEPQNCMLWPNKNWIIYMPTQFNRSIHFLDTHTHGVELVSWPSRDSVYSVTSVWAAEDCGSSFKSQPHSPPAALRSAPAPRCVGSTVSIQMHTKSQTLIVVFVVVEFYHFQNGIVHTFTQMKQNNVGCSTSLVSQPWAQQWCAVPSHASLSSVVIELLFTARHRKQQGTGT